MHHRFVLALAASLVICACDAAVIPLVDSDRYYSLYGLLNPQADSQSIVVFPIEHQLRPLPNEPIDARFTSTNLQTGHSVVWRDSVMQQGGEAVHVFWSPFRVEYGHAYHLEVERSDGVSSQVEISVPPQAELLVLEAEPSPPPIQEVLVTAPVGRLNQLTVTYHIRARVPPAAFSLGPVIDETNRPGFTPPEEEPDPDDDGLVEAVGQAIFNYAPHAIQESDGWRIPIQLSSDFRDIRDGVRQRGRYDLAFGIRLDHIEVSLIAANAEWAPPEGDFDPEVLIQPGTLTNVVRGFGFVGAGYPLVKTFLPNTDAVRIAGFTLPPGS